MNVVLGVIEAFVLAAVVACLSALAKGLLSL
jgi:hypothetical protein